MKYLFILFLFLSSLFSNNISTNIPLNPNVIMQEQEVIFKDTITNMLDLYKTKESIVFKDNMAELTAFNSTEIFDLNKVEYLKIFEDNKKRNLFLIEIDNRFIYFTDFAIYQKLGFKKIKSVFI